MVKEKDNKIKKYRKSPGERAAENKRYRQKLKTKMVTTVSATVS